MFLCARHTCPADTPAKSAITHRNQEFDLQQHQPKSPVNRGFGVSKRPFSGKIIE